MGVDEGFPPTGCCGAVLATHTSLRIHADKAVAGARATPLIRNRLAATHISLVFSRGGFSTPKRTITAEFSPMVSAPWKLHASIPRSHPLRSPLQASVRVAELRLR